MIRARVANPVADAGPRVRLVPVHRRLQGPSCTGIDREPRAGPARHPRDQRELARDLASLPPRVLRRARARPARERRRPRAGLRQPRARDARADPPRRIVPGHRARRRGARAARHRRRRRADRAGRAARASAARRRPSTRSTSWSVARFHQRPPPSFMATGRLDAVWQHNGLLEVRDYKTGSVVTERVADDPRARLQAWLAAPIAERLGLKLRIRYEHLAPGDRRRSRVLRARRGRSRGDR